MRNEEGKARLLIHLPRRLHREFKACAAREGRSMQHVIEERVRDYVERRKMDAEDQGEPAHEIRNAKISTSEFADMADYEKIERVILLRDLGFSLAHISQTMKDYGIPTLTGKVEWNKGLIDRILRQARRSEIVAPGLMDAHVEKWEKEQLEKIRRDANSVI